MSPSKFLCFLHNAAFLLPALVAASLVFWIALPRPVPEGYLIFLFLALLYLLYLDGVLLSPITLLGVLLLTSSSSSTSTVSCLQKIGLWFSSLALIGALFLVVIELLVWVPDWTKAVFFRCPRGLLGAAFGRLPWWLRFQDRYGVVATDERVGSETEGDAGGRGDNDKNGEHQADRGGESGSVRKRSGVQRDVGAGVGGESNVHPKHGDPRNLEDVDVFSGPEPTTPCSVAPGRFLLSHLRLRRFFLHRNYCTEDDTKDGAAARARLVSQVRPETGSHRRDDRNHRDKDEVPHSNVDRLALQDSAVQICEYLDKVGWVDRRPLAPLPATGTASSSLPGEERRREHRPKSEDSTPLDHKSLPQTPVSPTSSPPSSSSTTTTLRTLFHALRGLLNDLLLIPLLLLPVFLEPRLWRYVDEKNPKEYVFLFHGAGISTANWIYGRYRLCLERDFCDHVVAIGYFDSGWLGLKMSDGGKELEHWVQRAKELVREELGKVRGARAGWGANVETVSISFVGHSLGGLIAFALAEELGDEFEPSVGPGRSHDSGSDEHGQGVSGGPPCDGGVVRLRPHCLIAACSPFAGADLLAYAWKFLPEGFFRQMTIGDNRLQYDFLPGGGASLWLQGLWKRIFMLLVDEDDEHSSGPEIHPTMKEQRAGESALRASATSGSGHKAPFPRVHLLASSLDSIVWPHSAFCLVEERSGRGYGYPYPRPETSDSPNAMSSRISCVPGTSGRFFRVQGNGDFFKKSPSPSTRKNPHPLPLEAAAEKSGDTRRCEERSWEVITNCGHWNPAASGPFFDAVIEKLKGRTQQETT